MIVDGVDGVDEVDGCVSVYKCVSLGIWEFGGVGVCELISNSLLNSHTRALPHSHTIQYSIK